MTSGRLWSDRTHNIKPPQASNGQDATVGWSVSGGWWIKLAWNWALLGRFHMGFVLVAHHRHGSEFGCAISGSARMWFQVNWVLWVVKISFVQSKFNSVRIFIGLITGRHWLHVTIKRTEKKLPYLMFDWGFVYSLCLYYYLFCILVPYSLQRIIPAGISFLTYPQWERT